jgi:hypothetical protein
MYEASVRAGSSIPGHVVDGDGGDMQRLLQLHSDESAATLPEQKDRNMT